MYGNLTPEQMKQLNELLSQTTIGSQGTIDGQFNPQLAGLMQGPQPQPAPQMPQNFIQRMSDGQMTNMDYAAQPQMGPALDYTQPIEYAGLGKGYRVKGDPFTAMIGGNKVSLGVDSEATRKRQKDDLEIAKLRKDLNSSPMDTGSWKEFDANGKKYLIHSRTGQIKPAVVDGGQMTSTLSPSEQKVQKENQQTEDFKRSVTDSTSELTSVYNNLHKLGATVDPEQSIGHNVAARVQNSWLGQMAGGALGTKEQELRDKISSIRPLLINAIRKASQMGAKGMDSEKELQFYLDAATDPTRAYQSNLDALSRLDKAYGLGLGAQEQAPTAAPTAAPAKSQTQLMAEAQDAIRRGAPREAVMQRLQEQLRGQ